MNPDPCTCGEARRATGGAHLIGCPVTAEWRRLEARWEELATAQRQEGPDLTDVATHATGWYLLGSAALLLVVALVTLIRVTR